MKNVPKRDSTGGTGCDDSYVRLYERPMRIRMGLLDFIRLAKKRCNRIIEYP